MSARKSTSKDMNHKPHRMDPYRFMRLEIRSKSPKSALRPSAALISPLARLRLPEIRGTYGVCRP